MLITILAGGSRGDIQPYVALAIALKNTGHTVRLATFGAYESLVSGAGLEYFSVRGDISAVVADSVEAKQADNPLKVALSFNRLKSYLFDIQQDFFAACAGADVIIYHPGATIGYFAARQMRVPSVLALPFPMVPTREYPAVLFYNKPRLGPGFNRLTHQLTQSMMWSASAAPVKQFLKTKYGKLPAGFSNPFIQQTTPRLPTVVSCSNHVFPRPADWPEGVHNTGYWFLDEEAGWIPPAGLLDFLQAGPAPVYVGFGSIGDAAQARQTTELVLAALEQSGQRGVLATGWNGLLRLGNIPNGIFILESAPHSWLFPSMAAVVHHGGAGTTAAGLRAGVPSIIIPHGNDQFAWGQRVHELGVGAKPIPRKQLSAEKLADAIRSALGKETRDAAKDLGEKIRREDGAAAAARLILDCAKKTGRV
jgi:sterol 3beta-glucosyltransferase